MNELKKTLACVGVAAVVLVLVGFTGKSLVESTLDDTIGEPLFPEFADPLNARSLEIVNFDEETGSAQSFKVEQRDGIWSLPSHSNYPADAEDQMAESAASLIDLEIASVASINAKDHELYGVADPDSAKVGSVGVGKRVTLEDGSGKKLLNLIIGKEVADAPTIRYVRRVRKDPVYRVKISADKLTTKFEDWIEDDLLKLNSFEISQVTFNNYVVDENQGSINRDGEPLVVRYDDKDLKWSLDGLVEGEELDDEKLNGMKSAVDDLKIVDVQRKPAAVGPLLNRANLELNQQEFMAMRVSLQSHGFYFTPQGELFSNQGEVIVGMSNGVQYTLRFGEIALGSGAGDEGDQEAAKDGEGEEPKTDPFGGEGDPADGIDINRYIMVSVDFNEDLIPLPELPAEEAAPEEGAETAETTDDNAEEAPQDDPADSTDEASPEEAGSDEASPEEAGTDEETVDESADEQANAETYDAPIVFAQADGPEAPDAPADEAADETDDGANAESDPAEVEAEISEAEKEYQRKLEQRTKKMEEGQEKVAELNKRFGPWYYVISDDVYKKIRLDRAGIIKIDETPPGEGVNPEDFENLKQGLQP